MQPLSFFLAGVLGVLGFAGAMAALFLIAKWIVGPVDWAIRHRKSVSQYRMTDLFSLVHHPVLIFG